MHAHVKTLAADLQRIFGARLTSLVAYGDADGDGEVHTLALVDRLTFEDLNKCAPQIRNWRRAGAAVPLLLSRDEFLRSLDVFPIEYGNIIARHELLAGDDPFTGMHVNDADLRRACEQQVKSHLIHLREGYLESGADPASVARLISASVHSLKALIANLDRLDAGAAERAGVTPALLQEVAGAQSTTIADPSALFARYIVAVERLWHEVDRWRR
jgi:hypothetical protein